MRSVVPGALAALAVPALLLAPARGHSQLGGSLSLDQRDVRVFDNFSAASANDDVTPHPSFPGYTGAGRAIWKAAVEWGSELHGDGQGDPQQVGGLGTGAANFDFSWQGLATSVGTPDTNVCSEIATSGGGVLAYCETPIADGWRVRFHSNVPWDDESAGPLLGRTDLQGVAAHELGHALGLGHSQVFGATMYGTALGDGSNGRSIEADDVAGLAAIYGARAAAKPRITWVDVDAPTATLTITGTGFDPNSNEVWFTQAGAGGLGTPVKQLSVASSQAGTRIVLPFPAGAGAGDVLVRIPGGSHDRLSNAWPVDPTLDGTPFGPPVLTGFAPSSVTALAPGATTVTLSGNRLSGVTTLTVDGVALDPADFSAPDDMTIVFDAPRATRLGSVPVVATNLFGASAPGSLVVVADDPPALELDDAVILSSGGIRLRAGAAPGRVVLVFGSVDLVPSVLPGVVSAGIGNQFTSLVLLGSAVSPAAGWFELTVPVAGLPFGTALHFQAAVWDVSAPLPLPTTGAVSGTFYF